VIPLKVGPSNAVGDKITAFVSSPGEILNVSRVSRVELKDKFVILQTAKDGASSSPTRTSSASSSRPP